LKLSRTNENNGGKELNTPVKEEMFRPGEDKQLFWGEKSHSLSKNPLKVL
jgi:hypothetical protein